MKYLIEISLVLTPAIVSDVGLGTETSLLRVANGISRTIVVDLAPDYGDALDVGIGIGYGFFRTGARVRAHGVGARRSVTANVGFRAFVNICAFM